MNLPRDFWTQESGTVTVDWVILSALVIGFAASIGFSYIGQIQSAAEVISDNIKNSSPTLATPREGP